MSPSPTVPSVKWKKRKRGSSNLKTLTKKQKPYRDPDDEDQQEDEEYEEDEVAIQFDDTNEDDFDDSPAAADPNSGQIEVLSEAAVRISGFPFVSKHAVNRPHSSILAVAAVERGERFRSEIPQELPRLENISHGQLQSVSVIPASGVQERPNANSAAFVCKSPAIMEGKGVVKRFGDWGPLVLPMYADWFMPGSVHRLERHVVPHFFTGKSSDHTPERYMEVRNKIVAKYLENPCGRISANDCQNLGLGLGIKGHDLKRIVAFLDSWGIINYIAGSVQSHSKDVGPRLQEDTNEELLVPSVALRSFDSLIHFDKPKSKYRPEDVYLSASMSLGIEASDLDSRIRARLSEIYCSCCSKALPHSHYQSLKEADITLCVDCFHDGKFVPGHASIDFVRVDSTNDFSDLDGDSWTDQETLLLLEALEIYNDNWNEIAEHVGTKTKIQCILQFIRLPTENGLLENIELPVSSDVSKDEVYGNPYSHAKDSSGGFCLQVPDSENRIPFGNSGNPIMALVAFLASAVGPRVAAACAHASLSALAKDENHPQVDCSVHWDRLSSENMPSEEDAQLTPLSPERVKAGAKFGLSAAAMKAKLFADHEEREIQRLAATIVNHKLKRLELKLKQFAEVETLLMKECEQVESARQRLSAERARMMSVRFGLAGTATQPADAAAHNANPNSLNSNNRVPVISASGGPSNIQAFGNNQPAYHHSPFNPRQPIFSFGPRLPLSSINPSSSSRPASTGMLPSGSASAPYLGHPMLRSLSETNTNPN